MSSYRVAVEKALAGLPAFARSTAESILEIAYLAMAVDEHLRDEEIDAFSIIAAVMIGGRGQTKLDDASLRKWLDRFSGDLRRDSIHERLEAVVRSLGDDKGARLAAYRVACLMAMSDLDAADREFEFDLDLISTLGLTQDDADRVVDDVNSALAPADN